MSESHEYSAEEAAKKLSLRNPWKIGEKYPVGYLPSVEGMVVTTRWRDGVFMIVFLIPPFEKQGGTFTEAALTYCSASAVAKKALPQYDVPFPRDKRILQEVLKANGNIEMLQEIVNYINKVSRSEKPLDTVVKDTESPSWDTSNSSSLPEPIPINTAEASSSSSQLMELKSQLFSNNVLDHLTNELSRRLSMSHAADHSIDQFSATSSLRKVTNKRFCSPKPLKIPLKNVEHSLSTSSSSSTSKSSSDSDVGSLKSQKSTGWFSCPFSRSNSRQVTTPRKTMKGKHQERKMLRKTLHNLYNEFSTLKWYVDSLKPETLNASFRPYSSDLVWLSFHATYLNQLLLHATEGPWHSWNDLIVDHLTRSFLELLVRASPTRNYPEILDESVRRWMRRKRIRVSAQYGPVPSYLIDAKVTDSGIHPKGGWNPYSKKDARVSSASPSTFKPRPPPFPAEKKSSS